MTFVSGISSVHEVHGIDAADTGPFELGTNTININGILCNGMCNIMNSSCPSTFQICNLTLPPKYH